MKRRILFALAALLLVMLSGCGKQKKVPAVEEIVERLNAYPNSVIKLKRDETLAVEEHGKVYHGELVEDFWRLAEEGKHAELTTVSFTTEGAAMFVYVCYDDGSYLYVKDRTRDPWGGEVRIDTGTYTCAQWIDQTLILTDQPVESWEELRELYADSEKQYGWVFAMRENAGS